MKIRKFEEYIFEKAGSSKEVEVLTNLIFDTIQEIWRTRKTPYLTKIDMTIDFNDDRGVILTWELVSPVKGRYSRELAKFLRVPGKYFERDFLSGDGEYFFHSHTPLDTIDPAMYGFNTLHIKVDPNGFGGSMGSYNDDFTEGTLIANGYSNSLKSIINHEMNHLVQAVRKYNHKLWKSGRAGKDLHHGRSDLYYNELKNKFEKEEVYEDFNYLIYLSLKSEIGSRISESLQELKDMGIDLSTYERFSKALKKTTGWNNMISLQQGIEKDIIKIEVEKAFLNFFGKKKKQREYDEKIKVFVQEWYKGKNKHKLGNVRRETYKSINVKNAKAFIEKWDKNFTKAADEYKKKLVKLFSHFDRSKEDTRTLNQRLSTHKFNKKLPDYNKLVRNKTKTLVKENKMWYKTIPQILDWFKSKGNMTWIWIDTETTGLGGPKKQQLTQVSAIATRYNFNTNTFEELDVFDEKIKLTDETKSKYNDPNDKTKWVLSFNHYGTGGYKYKEEQKVVNDFFGWLDQFDNPFLIAQNAEFDMAMLAGRGEHKIIDEVFDTKMLIQLYYLPLLQSLSETDPKYKELVEFIGTSERDNGLISSSMSKVGPALGIDMDNYHDALTDCRITIQMYQGLINILEENKDIDISKYQTERIKVKRSE